MPHNFPMLAKTLYGFEDILAAELQKLGAQQLEKGVRSVRFVGDTGFLYKANLSLRTALKILKPIHQFKARNDHALCQGVNQVDWETYLTPESSFSVESTVHSDFFNHSLYVVHKTKDAIVDQFRKRQRKRPNVNTEQPDLKINIHIHHDHCTLSLDSSGDSLHQRGYRSLTNIAPINEVLAAGLILQSGWDGHTDLLDPMCGSGTFLIEAAMIAGNIPANINRKSFGFQGWLDYDPALYETIEQSVVKKIKNFSCKISGYDKAPSAVRKARENIEQANLQDFITVKPCNFFKTTKETDAPLYLIFNPPYGERLLIDMPTFYGQIGSTLKHGYLGTQAWFITANLEALKHVGLRPSKKIKTYNGKLEARFVNYQLYAGSRKQR